MVEQILNSYRLVLKDVRRMVSDLTEEQMSLRPAGLNSPAWTLGHLVYGAQAMAGELGMPPWMPDGWLDLFREGSCPPAQAQYPSKAQLLGALEDAYGRLAAGVRELGEAGLSLPLPDERYRADLPTVGHALLHSLSGHTSLHVGQLSAWRRAAGLAGGRTALQVVQVPLQSWPQRIGSVMAVRCAAYEQWNGPRTLQEQETEGKAWMAKWGQCRDPLLLLATDAGHTLGYLIGGQREAGELAIGHIGVTPNRQRQGIGQRLIESCEDFARRCGCQYVTTSTYNRFKGMLVMLFKAGYEIHDLTWIAASPEPRLLLRKALKD